MDKDQALERGDKHDDDKYNKSSKSRRDRSRSRSRGRGRRSRSRSRSRGRGRKSRSRSNSRGRRNRSRSRSNERHRSRKESSRKNRSASRSPEWNRPRKKGMWDKAPPGYEGMNVAQVATLNPSVLMPLITPTNALLHSRQARRLYVGNVPLQITDAELIEFFNSAMVAAKISAQGQTPVVGCQMNHEKNYAFIEFKTPEEASAGMGFDGIGLNGQILKIRRPKDYVAPTNSPGAPGAPPPAPVSPTPDDIPSSPSSYIPGIVPTTVQDTPGKVYIGGLPSHLTAEQVKEFVSTFGQLKSFHLVMDAATPSLSKGYGFFDYVDEGVTDRACKGLNGMQFGDKTLLVQRASPNNPNIPPMPQQLQQQQQQQQQSAPTTSFSSGPASNPLLTAILLGMAYMGSTSPPPATDTVMLLNMATMEEITQDNEYQALLEDVKDECSKAGPVKAVIIPREKSIGFSSILAKVYVMFENRDDAQTAHQTLGGRRYNGRTVVTHYVDSVPVF